MIAERMKASTHRLVSHFGGGSTVTLRRPHNLRNGNNGAPLTAVSVNGTTALGATSIDLDSAGLEGTLVSATTFTIAGDATVYTVSADVEAATGELTGVSFTPALVQEAADDAAVTLASGASHSAAAVVLAPRETDTVDGMVHEDNRILWISAHDLTVEPRDTDEIEVDGEREQVVAMRFQNTTGTPSGYRLILGAR